MRRPISRPTPPSSLPVAARWPAPIRVATAWCSFFERLQSLGGESFTVTPVEVLANDEHLVLFLRFTAERGGESLDVTVAGFHSDHRPDGWGRCTFLPDDMATFDSFFQER